SAPCRLLELRVRDPCACLERTTDGAGLVDRALRDRQELLALRVVQHREVDLELLGEHRVPVLRDQLRVLDADRRPVVVPQATGERPVAAHARARGEGDLQQLAGREHRTGLGRADLDARPACRVPRVGTGAVALDPQRVGRRGGRRVLGARGTRGGGLLRHEDHPSTGHRHGHGAGSDGPVGRSGSGRCSTRTGPRTFPTSRAPRPLAGRSRRDAATIVTMTENTSGGQDPAAVPPPGAPARRRVDGRDVLMRLGGVVAVIVVVWLIYLLLSAFLPRWWAQVIGNAVDGSFAAGAWWGLVTGAVFTLAPLLLLAQAFLPRRSWPVRGGFVLAAALLAVPNLLTLTVVLGTSSAAHAGERVLDVDGPAFRGG